MSISMENDLCEELLLYQANGWNLKSWRFGSDDFPFPRDEFFRFQPLVSGEFPSLIFCGFKPHNTNSANDFFGEKSFARRADFPPLFLLCWSKTKVDKIYVYCVYTYIIYIYIYSTFLRFPVEKSPHTHQKRKNSPHNSPTQIGSSEVHGSLYYQPKQCAIKVKRLKITIELHFLFPRKWVPFNDPCHLQAVALLNVYIQKMAWVISGQCLRREAVIFVYMGRTSGDHLDLQKLENVKTKQKHGKAVWYIQSFYFNQKTPNLQVSIENHQQQVSGTYTWFCMSCKPDKLQSGFESFIKSKTTANLRELNVSHLRLHQHLFSSTQTLT